eukprot:428717_1
MSSTGTDTHIVSQSQPEHVVQAITNTILKLSGQAQTEQILTQLNAIASQLHQLQIQLQKIPLKWTTEQTQLQTAKYISLVSLYRQHYTQYMLYSSQVQQLRTYLQQRTNTQSSSQTVNCNNNNEQITEQITKMKQELQKSQELLKQQIPEINNLKQQLKSQLSQIKELTQSTQHTEQLLNKTKTENNALKKENDTLMHENNKGGGEYVNINEHKALQCKYNEVQNQHRKVMQLSLDEINSLKNQKNELQQKYNGLKKRKEKLLVYKAWNSTEVINWIINIDLKRYNKYYNTLVNNIINEEIDGSCLCDLERNDMHRLGIIKFKDKRDILNEIQKLINNKELKCN